LFKKVGGFFWLGGGVGVGGWGLYVVGCRL